MRFSVAVFRENFDWQHGNRPLADFVANFIKWLFEEKDGHTS